MTGQDIMCVPNNKDFLWLLGGCVKSFDCRREQGINEGRMVYEVRIKG